jgi:DNA-binding CsgD family transcriptional regulator
VGATGPDELFGRERELAEIDAFLADAAAGPAALVLRGEAGIGKTALWREAVRRAEAVGCLVLATHPPQAEAKLSFAGLGDLVAPLVDELGALPAPQRRALDAALHDVEPGPEPSDPYAVALAFLTLLRGLERPVVVAVDDLQWLDVPSARAVEFAFRRLFDEPALLLATVRADAEPPLALDRPPVSERLRELPIGPLSREDLHDLLRREASVRLPQAALGRIHEVSGGNPLFALELVRGLGPSAAELRHGSPLPLPESLPEVVGARLAPASAQVRATLLVAATLSRPTPAAVEAAGGAVDDLREAERLGIVRLDGDLVRFAHPLLAAEIHGEATVEERRAVHERLAASAPTGEERARHRAAAAEPPDDAVAASLEEAAGAAAARGALDAAGDLYEQAAAFGSEPAATLRRRLAAADQHVRAGGIERARALLEQALAEAPSPADRLRVLAGLGDLLLDTDHVEAERIFLAALDEADGADDAVRAELHLGVAAARHNRAAATVSAEESFQTALELAERAGDAKLTAEAIAGLGLVRRWSPELLERGIELEQRAGGAVRLDWSPLFAKALLLANRGDRDGAREALQGLLVHARRRGDTGRSEVLWSLAYVGYAAGDYRSSLAYAEEALRVAEQCGRDAGMAPCLHECVRARCALGDLEGAARDAVRGAAAAAHTGVEEWTVRIPAELALDDLSRGDAAGAVRRLGPWIDDLRARGVVAERFWAINVTQHAIALSQAGMVDDARALVGELAPAAAGWPPPLRALFLFAEGSCDAAAGSLHEAVGALEEAIECAPAVVARLHLARMHLALGAVHRRLKRKEAARRSLAHALAEFEAMETPLWADRARAELGLVGGRASSPTELTAAEQRVADLVARGKSNYEIADALHLSRKTVEWNLAKIFRKLQVSNRAELAAKLARPRAG